MSVCAICGVNLKDDLFSFVTNEKVCSICKVNYIGGLPTTESRINAARCALGLPEGEYLQQDRAAEAKRILGKKSVQ